MRLLAALADATAGLYGGALAGTVYSHVHAHGDPFVQTFTTRILDAVCVPLFVMIRKWVFEGQIEDPHGEFFIVKKAAQSPGQGQGDHWRSGYIIEGSRLPQFLSQQLASKILRAGKSINFLQVS
jgi:gamma-tubulin complex component 3